MVEIESDRSNPALEPLSTDMSLAKVVLDVDDVEAIAGLNVD